jgi:hypothetical protein
MQIQHLSLFVTVDRAGNILNPQHARVKADYFQTSDACHSRYKPEIIEYIRK